MKSTNKSYSRYSLKTILFILFCMVENFIYAVPTADFYNDLSKLSTPVLFSKGKQYQQDAISDSALVCYTLLGNRYSPSASEEDKRCCILSFASIGYIYYFHYYDYSKAFESLARAKELMEENGVVYPEVYITYGLMYCSMGAQSGDKASIIQALNYLGKAFDSALAIGDTHTVNLAMANMISQSHEIGMTDSIKNRIQKFLKLTPPESKGERIYTHFNLCLYKGLSNLDKRNYPKAKQAFQAILDSLPSPLTDNYSRYACGAYQFLALTEEKKGDIAEAFRYMRKAIALADSFNIRDAKVELYSTMSNYHDKIGDRENKLLFQAKYLALKDTLLSYQELSRIGEIGFLEEMRKAERKLNEANLNKAKLEKGIWVAIGIIAAILIFLWMLSRKNKQLRRRNITLHDKNEELMKVESRELSLRSDYQKQIEELKSKLAEATLLQEPVDTPAEVKKYKSSYLSEEDKNDIVIKVLRVMEEETDIICSTDFSVDRLAELTGTKTKYVSQVINEKYECNFNAFLNKYRIREACRRLTDPANSHLTLEALSIGIGFKSRSTFVIQFKKFTGLTPSQYLNASRCATAV